MKLPTDLAKTSSKVFIETFENVYEHSPWIVEQALELVFAKNEYNSLEEFHQLLCEIMLLSGNMIWMWLAFNLATQMESMVMNLESWNDISVRESFSGLHSQSQSLAEIELLITMILPWLTRISVFHPSSSAN